MDKAPTAAEVKRNAEDPTRPYTMIRGILYRLTFFGCWVYRVNEKTGKVERSRRDFNAPLKGCGEWTPIE